MAGRTGNWRGNAVPALSWHPDALADVERLYRFLAQASPQSAARAVTTIRKAAQLMAQNPELGTPLAEFRQWPARFGKSAYVLRYLRLDDGSILIVRVWHSREQRGP
jgi:plasmid stabilization system protein ParE